VKRLYLLRHAKSDWADPALEDFDRPLNGRGLKSAPAMGRYMRREGLVPALVLCSPARRTRQTWELLAAALKAEPAVDYADDLYLGEPARLLKRIGQAPESLPSLLVIAHNPGLQALAHKLATGGDKAGRRRMATKYPTAALAVLDCDVGAWDQLASGLCVLERFVAPRDLM
jgi:phosphohistidine phosphatase